MNSQWPRLFDIYFLSPKTRLRQTESNTTSDDDLIFYVTRLMDNDFHHPLVCEQDLSFRLINIDLFSIWSKCVVIMIQNGQPKLVCRMTSH